MQQDMAFTTLPITWEVPRAEYVLFFDDALRVATILFAMQVMLTLQGVASLNAEFLIFVVDNVLAVALYWLVVRKVLGVRPSQSPESRRHSATQE
jgi:hypothetical protein